MCGIAIIDLVFVLGKCIEHRIHRHTNIWHCILIALNFNYISKSMQYAICRVGSRTTKAIRSHQPQARHLGEKANRCPLLGLDHSGLEAAPARRRWTASWCRGITERKAIGPNGIYLMEYFADMLGKKVGAVIEI